MAPITEQAVERLDRVLETMAQSQTDMVAAVARIEAVVEKETRVLDRVLDSLDKLESGVDELEKRAERFAGWKAGALAAAGGGTAFGIQRIIDLLQGN